MHEERLSDHCSTMSRPGEPPKPATPPADCPKDAVFINALNTGSSLKVIPGDAPYTFVFEGGDGDDKVVVVGKAKGGMLVRGGGGNDSLTIEDHWAWLAHEIGPSGLLLLGASGIVFAAVAAICWRALRTVERSR